MNFWPLSHTSFGKTCRKKEQNSSPVPAISNCFRFISLNTKYASHYLVTFILSPLRIRERSSLPFSSESIGRAYSTNSLVKVKNPVSLEEESFKHPTPDRLICEGHEEVRRGVSTLTV
ncbi:hypothetical protein Bca52824_080855 [Brassica carinata]|uniref:Uncharacterized protein n=1 Tax=Brassica carinata TaxID=52824 RepID=A0A8X7PJC3_BRACI|nr:hypothetical protein Bca52824_080855 [Brassica carinata]